VKGQREMSGRVDYSSHRAVSVISDLYTGLLEVMHEWMLACKYRITGRTICLTWGLGTGVAQSIQCLGYGLEDGGIGARLQEE